MWHSISIPMTLAVCAVFSAVAAAEPLGQTFTYQGRIDESGIPVNGTVDMQFSLWDGPADLRTAVQIGPTLILDDVPLDKGLFTVGLNFGAGAFDGDARWLEMGVRTGATTEPFTILSPRQNLTATPYALYALSGSGGGSWAVAGENIYNTNSGNVGIGTSAPEGMLHLQSAGKAEVVIEADTDNSGEADNARLVFSQDGGQVTGRIGYASGENGLEVMQEYNDVLLFGTNGVPRMTIAPNGNVGIGTTGPSSKLTIATRGSPGYPVSYYLHVDRTSINSETSLGPGAVSLNSTSPGRVSLGAGGGETVIGPLPDEMIVLDHDDGNSARITMKNAAGNDGVLIDSDQNIGNGGILELRNGSGVTTVDLDAHEWNGAGVVEARKGDGSVGAILYGESLPYHGSSLVLKNAPGNGGASTVVLEADRFGDGRGWVRADEIQTEVIQIMGGSDLSERFDVEENEVDVTPGMVVSIDPDLPGKLMVSREAYDRKAAGIVSGAGGLETGLKMGQSNSVADGEYPVALTGRVYCLCDASDQPIEPGDLLTTSDVPGHAMKVTDYELSRGAVIGKAMTRLEEGKGLVLVLVGLQ